MPCRGGLRKCLLDSKIRERFRDTRSVYGAERMSKTNKKCVRRAVTSEPKPGAMHQRRRYSNTQVYLSPEFHFGEDIMSNTVTPSVVSDVMKLTPIV